MLLGDYNDKEKKFDMKDQQCFQQLSGRVIKVGPLHIFRCVLIR